MYFPHLLFYIRIIIYPVYDGEVGWVTVHVYDEINKSLGKVASFLSADVSNLFCAPVKLVFNQLCQSPTPHCRRMQYSALQRTYLEPSLRLWGVLRRTMVTRLRPFESHTCVTSCSSPSTCNRERRTCECVTVRNDLLQHVIGRVVLFNV